MKIKVTDYIAEYLASEGVRTVFTVVGGGAMHLNDSLGHHPKLHCIYNHHEQASAIAAEAYFRVNNEMAACCVTSGPGAINALNGVVGAYQDSIPMLVLSGQCKTTLMTRSSGLPLRTFGNQEYDIIPTLQNATKYAETVMKAEDIRRCLEKAIYIARNGRPGPCWLEIPLDIQGSFINSDKLDGYVPEDDEFFRDAEKITEQIQKVLEKLISVKRPVLYAGNGIRISGCQKELVELAHKIGVPVATCWDSIDIAPTDDEYYVGRAGIMGDRAGNFAIQNSDLVIAIGNRLNLYQIGYQPELWAREACIVDVDIDPLELIKPTIKVDIPICSDARDFIDKLSKALDEMNCIDIKGRYEEWTNICQNWKRTYPVVQQRQLDQEHPVNIYGFIDKFSRLLPEGAITVVANGAASVVGSAAYYIGEGSRFIMNCALSSMGYDLPAAVGAAVAARGTHKMVICIAGDGSIQMNLQELQTIITNKLPVKVVVINNEGYHQIRLTQTNIFNKNFVGIGPESKDLGFPEFERLAYAYRMPYICIENAKDIEDKVNQFLKIDGYAILEVKCDTVQIFEPKSATKKLPNGSLVSPPLEDLAPFLDRDELRKNMIIDMVD